MRMTNKIMQNNSLYNINNNKILQDKLSTQMSTQKKITRPSDDPIIAIRALRLRTTVTELTQFYGTNASDAEAWMKVTEGALDTTGEILTDLMKQAEKGANKEKGPEDLAIAIEQMKALSKEFYSTGNVDYAGRYIFTGYRTNSTLTFTNDVESQDPSYEITEPVTINDFDKINYTDASQFEGLNKNTYKDAKYDNMAESAVTNNDLYRIRLSYDGLSAAQTPVIIYKDKTTGTETNFAPAAQLAASAEEAYQKVRDANNKNPKEEAVYFIPQTGELIFSDAAYSNLTNDMKEGTDIDITYTKNDWREGDLRPEHYFKCTATVEDDAGNPVKTRYNWDKDVNSQLIEYDVGYNQKIQVNTLAGDVFVHDVARDIDDLERALADLTEIDAIVKDLKLLKQDLNENNQDYEKVEKQLAAAEKAYDYIRENIHKLFEHTISKAQSYINQTTIAGTDNGTRSSRLDLISNRLMDQKSTFETLQSQNEDIDIAEIVIKLTSADLTYNAALMATGKIMQTSLMNYI